ncbi:LysR family transcriptional regulator [Pseudorhodoferax sp. Leaf267]|uniref:LysR family transcriptional regulator n=1 Tax=Pseudorhodoferax sp. Leaf267 TaxID=1736316 RepID=UPI0006F4A83B|nr:LysR family transcriptional regulator [Pseudorhodoferax sp. Leaf267]KQP11818.1 LysR family transcriptional regulator [Pseudorhodoferax sp. Leaf267]
MDRFAAVSLFVQVAETGSLTKASEALDISTSAASRQLIALEEHLGVRLVQRTTRQLSLTDAGLEFYRRTRSLLSDLREAEEAVTDSTARPTGVLRITASLSFCLLHIEPLLPEFTRRYPELSVDIVAANRYYDIIDNNIDLAIRTRQFEADSNITIRRLAATRRVLAAAPAYLEQHGWPQTPGDLAQHSMLVYTHAVDPHRLAFRQGDEKQEVVVKPLLEASDGQIVVQAALSGLGILVQPKYIVHAHLAAGRLVPVLDDWDLPRLTINFAFQSRRHLPAKVRLFMDAMTERFERHGYERLWTS